MKDERSKPKFWGEYSALSYRVLKGARSPVVVYEAGNSPLESQGYVSADKGVGLVVMRKFCESTTKEMAAEAGGEYAGVSEADDDEE
jgi:hypothetical protein